MSVVLRVQIPYTAASNPVLAGRLQRKENAIAKYTSFLRPALTFRKLSTVGGKAKARIKG